jgi:hypothetical protein
MLGILVLLVLLNLWIILECDFLGGRYWVNKHSGRVLTKAEEPRRSRMSVEDKRRLREMRVLRRLEPVKVGCRHLSDVGSGCVLFNFGFCRLDSRCCDVFGK